MLQRVLRLGIVCLLLLGINACGGSGSPDGSDALVRTRFDKSNPEQLLRYYLGGYAAPEGADPFGVGLVHERDGAFFIDTVVLDTLHAGLGEAITESAGGNALDWDEFEGFLLDTYYQARGVPPTVDALRRETPYAASDRGWFHVEVDGVMTTARRQVFVPVAALHHALRNYTSNDERLLYPIGTTLVGEHWEEGSVLETTVMRKRADGFWDFVTYGPDGTLAGATQPRPRALKSPTQCVGCHLGSKPFEPESSFPAEAAEGPHGPRALYVDAVLRDPEIVRFFEEHRKRSDTVLGLYNTLYVAGLKAARARGDLNPNEAELLDALGL